MENFSETVCYYVTRSIVTLKNTNREMICLCINDIDDDTFRMDFETFFSGHIINSQEYAALVSINDLYFIIAYYYSRVSEGGININFDIKKYSDINVATNDFNSLE